MAGEAACAMPAEHAEGERGVRVVGHVGRETADHA